MNELIEIEVVYALPRDQLLRQLCVPTGTTAQQAVEMAAISAAFPEIDMAQSQLGIFGKLVGPETVLHDRDRVEVYRPLLADPKEGRRRRARQGKQP